MTDRLLAWVEANDVWLGWLAAGSTLMFVASLLIVPWLLIRMPRDYFADPEHHTPILSGYPPIVVLALKILRNLIGPVLIVVGIVLLVLPGQGLLMILAGIILTDLPGKHRAIRWLVYRKNLARPINWLRRWAGKQPLSRVKQ